MLAVNFNDVARYYKGLPNQNRAFAILEEMCPDDVRAAFTEAWRSPSQEPTSKILDYVAQPDEFTCQAACVAKALGVKDVMKVRRTLLSYGDPGSPHVMAEMLKAARHYHLSLSASMTMIRDWLNGGSKIVITHGWFSGSGHVIAIVGKTEKGFIVDDPYGEFSFDQWRYLNPNGDNVLYSYQGIYASCVASHNVSHARVIYASGVVDFDHGNAWGHFVQN